MFINSITEFTPLPLPHKVLVAYINESNARENASFRTAFSSLVAIRWIDETASNLVLFIAVFN
jgi:hypothetical protein